jgi:hypothetical protein
MNDDDDDDDDNNNNNNCRRRSGNLWEECPLTDRGDTSN